MPEHLRRITIPTADGSRHELSVMTPQDLDPLLQRLERLERVGTLAEKLLSEGPAKLAEHLILEAVALPPGDYTGVLDTAEHLCEGTLYRLATGNYSVTPEKIASHFPNVVAIVSPVNACLVEPAQAYRGGAVMFAKGGLVYSNAFGSTNIGGKRYVFPRNVDSIHYWNFAWLLSFSVTEVTHSKLDEEAVPYAPPQYVDCSGFVNMDKINGLSFIDRTGKSRLTHVSGEISQWPGNNFALESAFRDWCTSPYPHNEVRLWTLPKILYTDGLIVDSMFAGLTDVREFPFIRLTGCPGTHLFQRNPDRLPDASIKRRCKISQIGTDARGQTEPQTDLSGLVNWDKDDLAYTIDNCKTAAVSPWKILLSKDAYASLTAAQRATLTSKGFTVVNAG